MFNLSNSASAQTIAGGYGYSLNICGDGTVEAWGNNLWGQLGNGTNIHSTSPLQVNSLTNIIAITDAENFSLALRGDGTVWAWGYNLRGQLGNGTNTDSNIPVQVSSLTNIIAIAGGGNHSLALKNDGTVWTWGDNASGQLGNGLNGPGTESYVPVQVNSLTNITAISGGWLHSLAIKNDGTVWSWGSNGYRQLGNGTTVSFSNIPVQVSLIAGITAISAARLSHSIALKNDGTVWTWGRNDYGQLGNGTTTISSVPVQVSTLTGITDISGGYYHTLALKNDGTAMAWGRNFDGQLGNGSNTDSHLPVQVSPLSNIKAIASGAYHNLTLSNDGSAKSWGDNVSGQLGTGNNSDSKVPVQVQGLCGAPLGIVENQLENLISVFPNPTNDFITIENNNDQLSSTYVILNSLGQQILSGQLSGETTIVDIGGLSSGFYLLLVGEGKHSYKLLKR